MNRNLVNLACVVVLLFVITACVCRSDRDKESLKGTPAASPQKSVEPTSTPEKADGNSKKDNGDFLVEHMPVSSSKFIELDKEIRNERLLEKAADQLNRKLILPHDITLKSAECGEVNAFYKPEDPSVTVCFELMEHFYSTFRSGGDGSDKAYDKMFDAVRFVFLHEVGHALIDTYGLPVTGNEEDAADRCSAYINIEELGEDGVNAVLAAAEAFQIESKHSAGRRDLADEHLLSEQRFYNSLCMLYGSDSEKYFKIVTEGFLPKERAARCESEYQRTRDSWVSLLEPWRKK